MAENKVRSIYPNLIQMMAEHDCKLADIALLLRISESSIRRRLVSRAYGGVEFNAYECHVLCEYFNKPFEWLFQVDDIA